MMDGLRHTVDGRTRVSNGVAGQDETTLKLTFDFRCRHPRQAALVCVRLVDFDGLTTPHPA